MAGRNGFAVSTLACFIVAALCVWAQAQEKESEHMRGKLQTVRVSTAFLLPETLSIKADEVVAWVNYSGAALEVIFSGEAVEKIHCKEPTRFRLAEDESLASGEIGPFEFAALCSFMPGEYEYTVHRRFNPSSPGGGTWKSVGHILVEK
jgi:hypothetical protein